MSDRVEIPEGGTGYSYIGLWLDGTLGWHGAQHIAPATTEKQVRRYATGPSDGLRRHAADGARAFLCRVTIEPVLDCRGRPITRIIRQDPPVQEEE